MITCSVSTKLAQFPNSSIPRLLYRVPARNRDLLETNAKVKHSPEMTHCST